MKTLRTETDDAIVLSPASGPARAAILWLHGLGADGGDFVPIVPELQLAADAGIRFVFPHADLRPVTVNAGYTMRAWYDIRSLTPAGRDDEEGLRDSAQRIVAYITRERVAGIPSERILLAGFSQGAALALYGGLRHDETLAGIIALSGYLPLRDKLAAEGTVANRRTPVLMCHGTADGVVDIDFGRQSRDALLAAGHDVDWREYPMAHGLHPAEVRDIAAFIRARLG